MGNLQSCGEGEVEMEVKLFEVRDKGTFLPIVAMAVSYEDGFLARRAGYGDRLILLGNLHGGQKFQYDHYAWGDRTYSIAHKFITENWDDLNSNDVIDVEFILQETTTKKISESTQEY